MLDKNLLGVIQCIDNNQDTIRVIESVVFNTEVIHLKTINDMNGEEKIETSVYLDKESALELGKMLIEWAKSNSW